MSLEDFPQHLVAEIARHLDSASDILALEKALNSTTSATKATCGIDTPSKATSRSSPRAQQPAPLESENITETFFDDSMKPDVQSEASALGERRGKESVLGEQDADDADGKAPAPATPSPPAPAGPPPRLSLLEEVLRLRWRDAWVLAGLPRGPALEAGVACAYAAALARGGGPPVRSCALAGYGGDEKESDGDGSDGDDGSESDDGSDTLASPLFGSLGPSPSSSSSPRRRRSTPHLSSSPSSSHCDRTTASSSPTSVFCAPLPRRGGRGAPLLEGDPGEGDGGRCSLRRRPRRPRLSRPCSPGRLPPASTVASALEILSADAPRLKQVARLSVAEALGPEPPLLRRAYRGFSYSPPEEARRGGMLLSSDDEEASTATAEAAGARRTTAAQQQQRQQQQASDASPRPPPLQPPPSPQPRLGEVSAEFLAWQTAASHLSTAWSSRLARCAAAARGGRAAAEGERGRGEDAASSRTRSGKEPVVAAVARRGGGASGSAAAA